MQDFACRYIDMQCEDVLMSGRPANGAPTSDLKRRLAAVAFADIVGYTILMARDEARTHRSWMTILDDVVRPQTEKHHGSIVKSTGDGVLAEFPSSHDAVEWAREVQRLVTAPPDRSGQQSSIVLRIAIHMGDIITTGFDVFGDCVNIAARLQEYAPAGGIVLSEPVYDSVQGDSGKLARDLGPLELKNLPKPVRAYALDPECGKLAVPVRPKEGKLPSIAILPLHNAAGNAADDYFCDGCMEDVTLSLAGLRELTVISLGSTLAYRGAQRDPKEIGQALGVRYVLMGGIRRSERLVRITVELCETERGATLWSEKAEVAPGELFDLQDRLVARIVSGIAPNLRAAELRNAIRKKPDNFTAYDYALRGLHVINALEPNAFLRALEFLERAMTEDPNFAMPVAWAARWHSLYVGQGWSPDPARDSKRAVELAAKAIDLDGQNALALATYGHLRSYLFHDYDTALSYFDRAFSACPNHALAWMLSVATLSYTGRGEQAVKHAEHALRLSPLDLTLFQFYSALALAHYVNGSYDEAVRWGKRSASENAHYTSNMRYLAAALVAHGNLKEARVVAASLIRYEPEFRLSVYRQTRQPFQDAAISAKFLDHLQSSGLPE